jgi:hypothetical protein
MPLRHEINGIAGPAPQRIARLRGEAHELPYIDTNRPALPAMKTA